MHEEKKKRGRPALSPEEKELHRIASAKRANDKKRENGWIAQKKYKKGIQKVSVLIPAESGPILDELLKQTHLSKSQLFLQAVEEKYDVHFKTKD